MTRLNKWQVEDSRIRTLHLRAPHAHSPADLVAQTGCTMRDAFRLTLIREIASVILIDAWMRGAIRFRSLLRIAIDYPDDPHAQVLAANLPGRKTTVDTREPSAT